LPEALRQGRPKGASVEGAGGKAETVRQKARPGAVTTSRWRAERRHVPETVRDYDQMTRRLARHPLIYSRGEERDYGLPGAAKNTGDFARALHPPLEGEG
jgi:hypothetical protein